MIVLGIDPGSRITGWGLLRREANQYHYLASGALRLGGSAPLSERLLRLSRGLEAVLAEHTPDHCAIERIFTARNAHSALVLGHARGVILCEIAKRGLPLHEYTPTQVKLAVVGGGRADKSQVQQMVSMLLGRRNAACQEDEADALAIALTHAAASRLEVAT
ncbi:MAG: crossover junction endodeoxyribonuclease RuvC [SAR324 cluster bacterium]|nr:crossover junction endodeoxyribonuclease RuvC [SAR324 cluster bacterium]